MGAAAGCPEWRSGGGCSARISAALLVRASAGLERLRLFRPAGLRRSVTKRRALPAVIVAIAMSVWRAREVKKVTTYGSTGGRRPGKFRLAGLLGCQSALNFDPISARGLINDAAGGQERPFVQTRASSQLAGFCFIVTTVPSGANIARTMSR